MKTKQPTNKKFREPTTQDIIDHLRDQAEAGKGFESQEELDSAVKQVLQPFDKSQMTVEEQQLLEGAAAPPDIPEPSPDTPSAAKEFVMPSTSDDLDFTMQFNDLGDIHVTQHERDLYMKTLLNDVPFQLPIEVFPGVTIKVRSRSVFYDDLVYDMLRESSIKGEVMGLESGFTKLMRYLAGVQLVEIQGKNVEFCVKEQTSVEDTVKYLKQHVKTLFDPMSLAKWNAVVKAIRIFDAKQKICNDKLLDRTFWQGADTN